MRVRCFAVSVAGLVSLTAATARPQEPADTLSPAQRAGQALARLGAHQRVQIVTRDRQFFEGSVVAASRSLITLQTDDSVNGIATRNIDSLWVRGGTHAGKGAVVGMVAGGLGLGLVAVSSWTEASSREGLTRGGAFAFGALLGGAGGAIVGALIGVTVPKWRLRVP